MNLDLKCRHHSAGAIREIRLPEYEDDLMGIPVILKNAVTQKVCGTCGEVISTTIPDLEGLRAAMAISRVNDSLKLNGRDIRFLRKTLNYTGKELARQLEVSAGTVSRWENDKELIGSTSEKLLRLIVGAVLGNEAPAMDFDSDSIVNMRIQSVRLQEDMFPIRLEWVVFKMPKQPKTHQWGSDEAKAA